MATEESEIVAGTLTEEDEEPNWEITSDEKLFNFLWSDVARVLQSDFHHAGDLREAVMLKFKESKEKWLKEQALPRVPSFENLSSIAKEKLEQQRQRLETLGQPLEAPRRKLGEQRAKLAHGLRKVSQRTKTRVGDGKERATAVVRRVVTGDRNCRVRDHVKRKARAAQERMRKPPTVKLMDKFSFTFGVLNICATEFVLLRHPTMFWAWFTLVMIPLLIVRYVLYKAQKFHYFMYDFCYFVQFIMLLHIWVWPDSAFIFQVTFVFSNGPLAFAILAWRNSLVFHSLDKVTSVFIHALPPILSYCMRWFDATAAKCPDGAQDCHLSWSSAVIQPLGLYLVWQILYILKTEVISRRKLERDQGLQTAVRWFTTHNSGLHTGARKVCRRIGILAPTEVFDANNTKTKLVFWFTQLLYTVVTIAPTPLMFMSFEVHSVFLLLVFICCVWNGASYYIETFSRTYQLKFHEATPETTSPDAGVSDGEASLYLDYTDEMTTSDDDDDNERQPIYSTPRATEFGGGYLGSEQDMGEQEDAALRQRKPRLVE